MPQPKQENRDVPLSRFISLVLRHDPSAAGISLDGHGWADVAALVAGVRQTGRTIDTETLERIVREDSKQRYSFSADHMKIRANQGHSIPVDVELSAQTPPDTLYHGTAERFLDSIRREGITRQQRQHVHLSAGFKTAVEVGARHGKAAVLPIDAAAMARDGVTFYLSENGVWLCGAVPWRYVKEQEIWRSSADK